jgi:hypothetical protein
MIRTHGLISPYGLGTAKKAGEFVGVVAKFVEKLRARWYEPGTFNVMECSSIFGGDNRGFLGKRKI